VVIKPCANRRLRHLGRPVNVFFAAATVAAGVTIGLGQRIIIFRLAISADDLPRLACAGCGHQIHGPRQALWLPLTSSGRCVACRARTGPPPAAVELSIAALLVGLAARVHPGLVLTGAAWLAVCAVPLAWIDAEVHRLPDPLTGWAYLGTVALLLLAAAASGHWHSFLRAAAGGLAFAGFCLVLSTHGLGLGDCKLGASLGTLLGWSSWATLFDGALAGFVLAGTYGICLLAAGRGDGQRHIAFGPFMIGGAFAVILFLPGGGPGCWHGRHRRRSHGLPPRPQDDGDTHLHG
jgi:leader peptidase (prepilin peptidase) / N-methyltransferase